MKILTHSHFSFGKPWNNKWNHLSPLLSEKGDEEEDRDEEEGGEGEGGGGGGIQSIIKVKQRRRRSACAHADTLVAGVSDSDQNWKGYIVNPCLISQTLNKLSSNLKKNVFVWAP